MTYPIQRQSDSYGVFDDGLHFAKDYTTRDLPEGLVNMLKGPHITAGLNDPRNAGLYDGPGSTHPVPPGYYAPDSEEARTGLSPEELQYGDFGHDPQRHIPESQMAPEQVPVNPDPHGFGFGGYDDYDRTSVENLPHDHLAQFRPHIASFTEARRLEAETDGPAPELFTPNLHQPGERLNPASMVLGEDWVTAAAAVQPQVVPGWIGHGYAPGHRVGLPWREQVIPGTVTHLDGQQVGIRWDDGQHSSEEPADLRPL